MRPLKKTTIAGLAGSEMSCQKRVLSTMRIPYPLMLWNMRRQKRGGSEGKWPAENGHAEQICSELRHHARAAADASFPPPSFPKWLARSPFRPSHRSTKVTSLNFAGQYKAPSLQLVGLCVWTRRDVLRPRALGVRTFPRTGMEKGVTGS
jgi:hypothetical protein